MPHQTTPPGPTADDLRSSLAGRTPRRLPGPGLRRSAVLIPVLAPAPHAPLEVLFTRRADHLPKHAGQISFPGGGAQPEDAGPWHTALREAHEEIGLAPQQVERLGGVGDLLTGTGFHIRAYVGLVGEGFVPRPDPAEVAEIFTVPLSSLLAMRPQRHRVPQFRRVFLAYPWGDHLIWGATARLLSRLLDQLRDP